MTVLIIRKVELVLAAGVVLALAGCGSSTGGTGPDAATNAPASCSHSTGFALSLARDAGGQPTALKAAVWFAAHGGEQDLPLKGWRAVGRDSAGVTLRAGTSTVHAIQVSDGTWMVDSGTLCR